MDSRGQIFLDPTEEEVKAKKLIPIPKEHAEATINMNRKERREWYRAQKKKARHLAKVAARRKEIDEDVAELSAATDSAQEHKNEG